MSSLIISGWIKINSPANLEAVSQHIIGHDVKSQHNNNVHLFILLRVELTGEKISKFCFHPSFQPSPPIRPSPRPSPQERLQQHQAQSPKTHMLSAMPKSIGSHKKPRSEVRKCRKVYGMENRDMWCTQCKWKKACTRFLDWGCELRVELCHEGYLGIRKLRSPLSACSSMHIVLGPSCSKLMMSLVNVSFNFDH